MTIAAEGFPVAVLLRCQQRQRGPWRYPSWSLAGVFPGSGDSGEAQGRVVHRGEDGIDYLWTGLRVRLLRSGAETYWFNLTSRVPSLFVVCREDPQNGLMPLVVTLDQDDAMRQLEGDGEVFSTSMPEPLWREVEQFVMTHYRPEPKKRGRRERND